MGKLFGTDGIRGIANEYPMTADLAFELGKAIGCYIRQDEKKKIIIGRDTRLSGDMLESALAAGLCSTGIYVFKAGIVTTPAIAFLTKLHQASMGIVISASHNPYYDNGIKLFNRNGYKLAEQQEKEIEDILLKRKYTGHEVFKKNIGKIVDLDNAADDYIEKIIQSIPLNFQKTDYKMIIDCANGASSQIVEELYQKIGLKNIKIINHTPNGTNINHHCGSTSMGQLKRTVIQEKADLGIAFDGDADRVLAVDEKGQMVDGDQIMVIYSDVFMQKGKLGNNKVVTTCMSNLGFDEAIERMGGTVFRTDVGDKYVLKKMLAEKSLLGGEQSGHIIFIDEGPNGDGIVTSLKLLHALSFSEKRVSERANIMKKYHQKLLNYDVPDKKMLMKTPSFCQLKDALQKDFRNVGRILIRPSGTEKKIRILLESRDEGLIQNWQDNLSQYFKSIRID